MEEIREIPEGWEEKALEKITTLITKGTTPTTYGYNFENEGVNFIKVESIQNSKIDVDSLPKISKECNDYLERSNLKENDLLFSIAGSLGQTVIIDKSILPANTNQALSIIRLSNKIDIQYVYHFLNSSFIRKDIGALQTIGAQPNLSLAQIKSFLIIAPKSKQEQQKVSKILSTLDQNIEKTEQTIEKYRKIKNGLMDDLLTGKRRFKDGKWVVETEFKDVDGVGNVPKDWEEKSFDKISKVRQGLQIAIEDRYKEDDGNSYIYITLQYLKDTQNEANLFYIKSPKESVICKKHHILMTRTGNTGQVVTNVEGVFHNNFFLIDFDKKQVTKEYLYYYLNTFFIQNLISNYAGSTTIPDLNHGDFYKLPVCFPLNLEEQKQISNILSKQDCLIEKEQQYLQKLKSLKSGLMEDLLTGKVRVKI